MNRLLADYLSKSLKKGSLELVDAKGTVYRFGDGTGQHVRARFTSKSAERGVVLNPELKLGEAFMDGGLVLDQGSIYDFLEVVLQNMGGTGRAWWWRVIYHFRVWTRRFRQWNTPFRSRQNVAHHYDLDGRLYSLFLDSDQQYSCAYFETPDSSLEEAQLAKKRHLAAKLALAPGQRVLDIGSGWGGLGLYLASRADIDVTGVTLSEEQHKVSNARAQEQDLAHRARFLLQDYRSLKPKFDRIISVGMFEHVGVGHFSEYFEKARDLLADDGVMVLHSIGRFDMPGETNSWIQKYIFPGGYIPSLSEVLPAIEKAGLKVTDIEILRLHYAETLRAWRERFMARRDEALALYDEAFCRMWEFYLAASETAFRYQDMMIFQIQLVRDQNALPLTRDYIWQAEEALRRRDQAGQRPSLKIAGE
ncbi:cyclopropane-fatty-acyl-phospholipid synthase [Kaistia dalseonensis]|uniref:Cyclopropane-fatty-acyl-phospholipid synthase n=1 Tax=Kaistia dalseonensis TaxID=410840 RepID=A0ABU0H0A3_9HYPH|nr:cyclopropane-fatty-acyl-phospholipid synthase family protein [Kaistia dalseonensis]MCX5493184.1 cyclopropane-fatty-acyl-phospholipid synthase [Kaistia dalseonensis]MDQ0435739.1 cyclopropane-fatty-acyl-phospholipid synthase [Kaistia dalseonensis]